MRATVITRLRSHALALVAWLWAAAYLFATRTQPLRLNWGDPWSDSNVQVSGRHFAESGFIANAFTPVIDVGPQTPESLKYTHYPPLPDLVNGVQQRLFGPLDISAYRILADVLTLASVLFFYRWVRAVWGAVTANVAVALLTTSLLWLQYADTIHHIPLYWFFGFATLDLTASWLASRRRSLPWLAGVATFFCMMASYDFFFFVPVLVAATVWLKGERLRAGAGRTIGIAIVSGLIIAVVVKFAFVAWAVGPRTFASDLVFQLQERTTAKHSTDYRGGLVPIFFGRCTRFFTPLFFVVAAIQLFALGRRLLRGGSTALASPLVLLAGGVPFLVVFSQLFVEQYHPTLELLPYYAVGTASLVASAWQRGASWRLVAAAMVVFALGWQARQLSTFDKAFLERADARAVREYLDANDHRRLLLTNALVDAPVRTYFDRHVVSVGHITKEDVPRFVAEFFEQTGDEPAHFVEFTAVEKTAFDKMLYGLFAREGRWDWIANPGAHRSEWEPIVRDRNAEAVEAFHEFATCVVDTGRMRVWRIDPVPFQAFRDRVIDEPSTRHIDFGDPSSNKYKVVGVRFSENPGGQPGFSWTTRRQRFRSRFTMHGLLQVPVGPPNDTAVFHLRAPARDARITMALYTSVPDQRVDVVLNGHPVGRWDVAQEWKRYSVVVKADELDASGLQQLELHVSAMNESMLGVAIRTLDVDEP